MQVVALYFLGIARHFAKLGRWLDLAVGLALLTLGALWANYWMIGCGIFSLLASALNLNGWVHNKSMAYAQSRVRRKR